MARHVKAPSADLAREREGNNIIQISRNKPYMHFEKSYINFPSSQSDAILKRRGGVFGLPSVRKSCLPVRPIKKGAIGAASFSKMATPKRNGS